MFTTLSSASSRPKNICFTAPASPVQLRCRCCVEKSEQAERQELSLALLLPALEQKPLCPRPVDLRPAASPSVKTPLSIPSPLDRSSPVGTRLSRADNVRRVYAAKASTQSKPCVSPSLNQTSSLPSSHSSLKSAHPSSPHHPQLHPSSLRPPSQSAHPWQRCPRSHSTLHSL